MPTQVAILNIVLLSLIAGLGTGLGGLIAVIRRPGRRSFGLMMGFTAGVMLSLSFLELVNKAWELAGFWTATAGFACGSLLMFLLDFFTPHMRFGEAEVRGKETVPEPCPCPDDKPHRARWNRVDWGRFGRYRRHSIRSNRITDPRLLRTGLLLMVGITLHNIPEGIAVGAGYMHNPDFGLFIAAAILMHNIPEGIATALPLCKSGVCRWDSFRAATLSGLSEPIGALLAALFLAPFKQLVPAALAFAGGVMVFITLDELLPTAREHGHQHTTALGIILGSIFVFILSGLFGV